MASSTRFPNLREFRARVAALGHRAGGEELVTLPSPREPAAPVPWMWIALGVAGVSALAVVAFQARDPGRAADQPGLAAAPLAPPRAAPVPVLSSAEQVRLAEARRLEARLARLEDEIASLASEAARSERLVGDLQHRLDIVEEAFGPLTGSIEPAPTPAPSQPVRQIPPDPARAAAQPPTTLFDMGTDTSTELADVPVQTPSPHLLAPRIAYGVDLGGFGNLGDLKRYWAQVVGENPLLLGGLVPRQVTRVEADGIRSFRLIAGPLEDVAASARLCQSLHSRQIGCTQTIDGGETI